VEIWKDRLFGKPVVVGTVVGLRVPIDTASPTFLKWFKNMARFMTAPHSIIRRYSTKKKILHKVYIHISTSSLMGDKELRYTHK